VLASERGASDDGTSWLNSYDGQGRQTARTDYSAGGVKTSATAYDPGNQYGWSSYTDYFGSSGVLASERGANDDGTNWLNFYDGQGRQTARTDYSAGGVKTSTTAYDPGNQYGWSSYTDYFSASGTQTSEAGTNDDGRIWSAGYDNLGQLSWVIWYASSGTISSASYWDTKNQYAWASYTSSYDASGTLVSETGRYDNGTTWERAFT
jgi:hypothetical protein